jgi:hypothetical protein
MEVTNIRTKTFACSTPPNESFGKDENRSDMTGLQHQKSNRVSAEILGEIVIS